MEQVKYSRYYTYIKPVVGNPIIKSYGSQIFNVVATVILLIFAIRPTISAITNLHQDISNHQKTLQSLSEKVINLTTAKKNYEALSQETRDKINRVIPNRVEVALLVADLEKLAPKTASASASTIQIQPLSLTTTDISYKMRPELGEVSFTFYLEGSYQELLALTAQLSQSPRLLNIQNLTLSKQPDGPLVFSITGKGYYLK